MKREIKFRVWHNARKEWVHDAKPPHGGINLFGETILMGELLQHPLEELNDYVAMQFTGIIDRNGVEIYEGDVLEIADEFTEPTNLTAFNVIQYPTDARFGLVFRGTKKTVWFSDGAFKAGNSRFVGSQVRVVGNIYDNPEL